MKIEFLSEMLVMKLLLEDSVTNGEKSMLCWNKI